ncbi:MAG: WecB/TagA/CpsF family glycosyltransferase [Tepidisphaeraceae bacterium]
MTSLSALLPNHSPISGPAAVSAGPIGPVSRPGKRRLFGVDVSVTHYAEVFDYLLQVARSGGRAIVDFAPANIIVEAASDPEFRRRLNEFDLVCPDGQPVRWCLNHFHKAGLTDRVYGPSCTLKLCEAAEQQGVSIYLYGASPETLALFQQQLLQRFPKLRIAGAESPPYRPLTPDEDRETVERINRSGAGLIFIGTGSIKQENFAWSHRDSINGVQLCVGAAFDFIAGTKPTAPGWMQRRGLEWLFRLVKEPKRLFKRYAITNSLFLMYVFREKLRGPNPA